MSKQVDPNAKPVPQHILDKIPTVSADAYTSQLESDVDHWQARAGQAERIVEQVREWRIELRRVSENFPLPPERVAAEFERLDAILKGETK